MRKILLINRVFPPTRGATGRILLEFASALSGEGYDVTVLTTGPKATTSRELYGIEIVRVKAPANPRFMLANLIISLRLFFKALFLRRPDIIITKSDPPLFVFFGYLLALLKRSKHINWVQDLYPDILPAVRYKTSPTLYKIIDALTSFALKRCHRVVTIGNCMRHRILKKGVAPEKVKIVPNWYDSVLNKVKTEEAEQSELPMKFRVLYAGNIGRAHPYETILDAAEILYENDTDIEFLFVGSTARLQALAKERARRGLDNVRFLPYQPRRKLRAMLESGDIHIISMSEEAVGCMLPSRIYDVFEIQRPCIFVGPETSDLSLMLEHYEAGLTIQQGEPEILANAIRHLRDNGQDWHTLYEGAAQAAKAFTPELSLEKWQKLLKDL